MRPTATRAFRVFGALLGHENPLGLPRSGTIPRMSRGLPERRKIRDVAKVVAVSSAKGGVGKSTVAGPFAFKIHCFYSSLTLLLSVPFPARRGEEPIYTANLSLAFARLGYRSGILDADIFGPSIPTLFDLSGEPRLSSSESRTPHPPTLSAWLLLTR